jgi:hypothetical protein
MSKLKKIKVCGFGFRNIYTQMGMAGINIIVSKKKPTVDLEMMNPKGGTYLNRREAIELAIHLKEFINR